MMRKSLPFTLVVACVWGTETPPPIPAGQISYDDFSYQGTSTGGMPSEFDVDPMANTHAVHPASPAGVPSSSPRLGIDLCAYASNYQVRGMGVTDDLSKYGASTVAVSYVLGNRNLFNAGIQQRVRGLAGVIWDASCPLGDIMQYEVGYALGKEVLPNFLVEVGYNFRRGGLEGYMAKWHDNTSHRSEQDINLRMVYDDHQRGFFGHLELGAGFYGLTGYYADVESGYRFTDIVAPRMLGWDLEVSAGVAPSLSYWGSGVEGIDAYRIRMSFLPYSSGGRIGRDARTQIKPWVQCSWTGSNARKITRNLGYTPVDHFQFTVGLDVGFRF